MALVKLRSYKPKSKQGPAESLARAKKASPQSNSRPQGVRFTMEESYAAFLKARFDTPSQVLEAVEPPISIGVPVHKAPGRNQLANGGAQKTRKARRKAVSGPVDLEQPGYLRLVDVLAVFPVSRAKWYAGIKSGIYPQSHPLGVRARGWRTSDIKSLIDGAADKP